MRFICLFFPALIAMQGEVKKEDDNLKKISVFCKYCLYINFIMILILMALKKSLIHFDDLRTVHYYALYLLVGILCSKFLPKVLEFCKNNFNIEVRRNNK